MPYGGDSNAFEDFNLCQIIISLQQKDYLATAKRLFGYSKKTIWLLQKLIGLLQKAYFTTIIKSFHYSNKTT